MKQTDARQNKKPHTAAEKGAFSANKIVDKAVYDALYAVFVEGAYCQKAITDALHSLKEKRSHAFVTSCFYGILDKNISLEKIIGGLCDRSPGQAASVILKIGLYYLRYADIPNYAAVDRTVTLSKAINGVYSGFINAVLKRSVGYEPKFKNGIERFSYLHNAPEWLCKELILDYSENRAASILDAELPDKTHIRPIAKRISQSDFSAAAAVVSCEMTEYGCYCDRAQLDSLAENTVVAQSLASMRAVNVYKKGIDGGKALDLCAAPGGKSVYLYELGDFDITACDIYPHKLELINKLAKKTGADINVELNDATVLNEKYLDKFDLVIADCPCSGTGTIGSKPDILLRRKPQDVDDLCKIQLNILDNAAKYVKKGGVLCYSTCSVLKRENEKISAAFLSGHSDYFALDEVKYLPDTDKCDGFYIARFRRKDI